MLSVILVCGIYFRRGPNWFGYRLVADSSKEETPSQIFVSAIVFARADVIGYQP
jgi:hypothetical protein